MDGRTTGAVLILGGTPEAAALARLASAEGLDAVTSLAGATSRPMRPAGRVRIGGFGGADGLAAFLRAEGIGRVVDATHPFAARMHANAAAACAAAGVPLLRLLRPPWAPEPGDRWLDARDAQEAASLLGPALFHEAEGVVFLAVGRKDLAAFAGVDRPVLVRLIEPAPLPIGVATLILSRGPFRLEGELALLRDKAVRVVVAKNSGGAGAYAKLAAARALGLPVVMIARPPLPPAEETASVDAAFAWLRK